MPRAFDVFCYFPIFFEYSQLSADSNYFYTIKADFQLLEFSERAEILLFARENVALKLNGYIRPSNFLFVGSQPKIKKIVDKTVDHPQFFIGDSQVENVDRSKYLGVIIDRSLSWEEHINILRTKVSRAIIVEPDFRYCCSVLGCCGAT